MRNFMKEVMKKWKWKIDPDPVISLFYIWQFLTPAVISSKESGYFLIRIQSLLSGAGMDAWWLTEHLVRKAAHFTSMQAWDFCWQ